MVDLAGCISKEEFHRCCTEIVDLSKILSDTFQTFVNPHDADEIYLVKKQQMILSRSANVSIETIEELPGIDEQIEEILDHASLNDDHSKELVNFEYHILYSGSYNVPVCYFRAFKQDGSPLKLAEVWNLVSAEHKHALKEKWSFITQQEHPYLMTPFFQLHPCHTMNMMQALNPQKRKVNYVLVWLSAISSVVNLDISMDYFTKTTT